MTDDLKWPEDWPETVWTPEQWHKAMLRRLDKWLAWDKHDPKRPKVHTWMGMSLDHMVSWRMTGVVPRETRILWTIFPEELEL